MLASYAASFGIDIFEGDKYTVDEKLINFEQETTYDNKIQKNLPKLYIAIQNDNDSLTRV